MGSAERNGHAAGRPRILVVDDDAPLRRAIRRLLSQGGFTVELAGGGAEALVRLQRSPRPELVLLDLRMPDVPGQEVLRAGLALAAPPVMVVMSGSFDTMSKSELLAAGATACVDKPLALEALVQLLRRLTRQAP
jgi:CheY-like chemotaxis protein